MKRYQFAAADAAGAVRRGHLVAESEAGALEQLGRSGLLPIEVGPARSGPGWRAGPSRAELAYLFRSLASLVSTGLPLPQAVASARRLTRGVTAESLEQVEDALRRGQMLSRAFAETVVSLPPIASGVLEASERGGQLDRGLEQVARGLEREAERVSRLRQAIAYPAFLLVIGLLSCGLIAGIVVPKFAGLLADLGQEPPPLTRIMLDVAAAFRRYWTVIPAAIAAVAVTVIRLRDPEARRSLDWALLRIPLFGSLIHQMASGRVSGALGAAVDAGVPLLGGLDAASLAAGNRELAARIARVRARVAEGQPLGTSLEREAALTPDVIRLVSLGEANGQLAAMLVRASDLAIDDAERRLKSMMSLLEPALIVGLAVGVGLVAAALLQAVYSLRPAVGQ